MDWQQLSGVLGQQLPAQPAAGAGDVTSSLAAATTGAAAQPQAQLASLYYQQLLGQQLQSQQLQTQQQGLAGVPGLNPGLQASQNPLADATALQQLYGQQGGLLGLQLQQAIPGLGLQQQSAALLQQQLLAAAAAGGFQGQLRGAAQEAKFARASASSSGDPAATTVYLGDIVDYDEQKGFGFIECADTQKLYGIDIFLLRSALDGAVVNPGDKVNFQVEKGPKGPKAANVAVVQKIEDREDLPTFYGIVKRYDEQRGLGFIDCAETMELYGKDILVFKSQLGDAGKRNGAKLSFSIIKDARGVKAAKVKILVDFPPGMDHKKVDAGKLTPKLVNDPMANPQALLALPGADMASGAAGSLAAGGPPPDWKPDWQKPTAKFMMRPPLRPQIMPPRERSRSPKAVGSDAWASGSDSWAAGSETWTAPASGTSPEWRTW
mmetsp:Transcript_6296/g.12101  ORF Transcript_6296/g.12101 Transcript_6296/m.12101 type:complete len:436 (+) Transcript_6296:121-1428(+)